MDARPFDTIHDILRWLSLVLYVLEDRNAPIWRKREATHMLPEGSNRLRQTVSHFRNFWHGVEISEIFGEYEIIFIVLTNMSMYKL